MESEIQSTEINQGFDDHLISLLGGIIIGATVWALGFGLVAIINAAATPPGINVLEVISGAKLVPPPGIDLSNIIIAFSLPKSNILDITFVAVPILFGLIAAGVGYRKILKMD